MISLYLRVSQGNLIKRAFRGLPSALVLKVLQSGSTCTFVGCFYGIWTWKELIILNYPSLRLVFCLPNNNLPLSISHISALPQTRPHVIYSSLVTFSSLSYQSVIFPGHIWFTLLVYQFGTMAALLFRIILSIYTDTGDEINEII